jgi:Fe2+ or Zn2+ uptake regulation protein
LPEDRALEKRLRSLAYARGFAAQDHQLEIRGLCSSCVLSKN